MEISEKCPLPSLNPDFSLSFKPKKLLNLEIDINMNEEDEKLLKLRDIPRRKSSTGSTSTSKPEDPSELFSCPDSPTDTTPSNKEFISKKLFFSNKDKNSTNPLYNFYQTTEEYFQEKYPENKNYTKSKNYISKQDYLENLFSSPKEQEKPKEEIKSSNNNFMEQTQTVNNTPLTPIPTLIAPYNPSLYNGIKGKFDMPMYYCVGFYQYDPNLIYNNKESSTMKTKTEEKKEENGTNINNIKNEQQKQTPIMIGTPIFFNNIPKFGYNKTFKRKGKPFTEREGDWVCHSCKNLNFAFRVECNRCHLPKDSETKKDKMKGIKKGK